jgi:hypothetical protein
MATAHPREKRERAPLAGCSIAQWTGLPSELSPLFVFLDAIVASLFLHLRWLVRPPLVCT